MRIRPLGRQSPAEVQRVPRRQARETESNRWSPVAMSAHPYDRSYLVDRAPSRSQRNDDRTRLSQARCPQTNGPRGRSAALTTYRKWPSEFRKRIGMRSPSPGFGAFDHPSVAIGMVGVDKMRQDLAMWGFRIGTEPRRNLTRPTRAVEVLCHFVFSTHPFQ